MKRHPQPLRALRRFGPGASSQARGVVIIEALIAMLIFSIAALGLMGMHTMMSRAVTTSKNRLTASLLANDIIGQMWADIPNLEKFDTKKDCASYTRCANWKAKVEERLPSGGTDLDVDSSTGAVVVTILWSSPGSVERHKYVTAAYVKK